MPLSGAQARSCRLGAGFKLPKFDGGVQSRLICSILAPADRSLRVIGMEGVATLADMWEHHIPVRVSRTGMALSSRVARKTEHKLHRMAPGLMLGRRMWPDGPRALWMHGGHHMNFIGGIAQLADEIGHVPPAAGAALARQDEVAVARHISARG